MAEVHRYKVLKMKSEGGGVLTYTPEGPEIVMAAAYDALLAENAALRTQLTSQGGEAVEVVGWRRLDRPYELTAYPSVCAMWYGVGYPVQALYTNPAASVPAGCKVVPEGWQLVPEARETGAWESARIGDFNAGWNACRDSVFTLLKKAAYMELDTAKRSIAIQDELRALLASAEGVKDE